MSEVYSAAKAGTRVGPFGAYIAGLGWGLPDRRVSNEEVAQGMIPFLDPPESVNITAGKPTDGKWVRKAAGVELRRWTNPGEKLYDYSALACQRALDAAGCTIQDIDRIIVGTVTPEDHWPSEAAWITHAFGDPKISGHDVTAACTSFMYALEQGYMAIRSGMSERVLVVGADAMARAANPRDRGSFMLFGDAAAAVVLAADAPERDCFLYLNSGQDTSYIDLIGSKVVPEAADYPDEAVSRGLRRVWMKGPQVYEAVVPMGSQLIREALEKTGLKPEDIAAFCMHQANDRITTAIMRAVGLRPERVIRNINRFGNTTSAGVPLGLGEAFTRHLHDPQFPEIRPGDPVLLYAFGGGLTYVLAIVRWSDKHPRAKDIPWAMEQAQDLFGM
jgi:3-oxoacyl-[acyl-carrier-protein] synthase-3